MQMRERWNASTARHGLRTPACQRLHVQRSPPPTIECTAYFINVSRGKLADTPALVRALGGGWIAGTGLDVARNAPLPADDPLWSAPSAIITCCTSGRTPRTVEPQMTLLKENIRRYANRLSLLSVKGRKRRY